MGWVWLLCALPFVQALFLLVVKGVGPDPGEWLVAFTGEWALRLLILTLLVSPCVRLTGASKLRLSRRPLGLSCFLYACLHLLIFVQIYTGWQISVVLEELLERPYIAIGFSALGLMLPLALTSSRRAVIKLGRRWKSLHRLVYPAAVLAAIHFIWLSRGDYTEALIYSGLIAGLLSWRVASTNRSVYTDISSIRKP